MPGGERFSHLPKVAIYVAFFKAGIDKTPEQKLDTIM
jgi:hypothetical protein